MEFFGNNRQVVPVLGLHWIPEMDILIIDAKALQVDLEQSVITKSLMLSLAQRSDWFLFPKIIAARALGKTLWMGCPVEEDITNIFRNGPQSY